ncbi:DUF1819 family protein [Pseudomonas sp. PDM11]|uniref:DUF1819 family protein n=1 Tax=Pseudomonas sp. PDM11 TaxID=2769309 RepID=UPI001CE123C5|nr:DUF1819 family protein [Pseudomonas sp. PDM11]
MTISGWIWHVLWTRRLLDLSGTYRQQGRQGSNGGHACNGVGCVLDSPIASLSSMCSALGRLSLAFSPAGTQNRRFDVVDEFEVLMSSVYLANFTKCSLIVPEARIVAGLLLQDVEPREWERQVHELNVLQKRTAKTAATYANLARARLQTMDADLWHLVRDGSMPVATHAVLAATVKFSPLFGDFLRTVVRDQFRRFATHLETRHWDAYLEDSLRSQPNMLTLSDSTRVKLRQNAMRMLAEAGFIENTRSLRLRSQQIEPAVLHYLRQHNEQYVLDCLQVCP